MKVNPKKIQARKMLTPFEREVRKNAFDGLAWKKRKVARGERVIKKIKASQDRRLERQKQSRPRTGLLSRLARTKVYGK